MTSGNNRVVLTIEEAAQRLGIGRTTMYGLIKTGKIRTVTIGRLRRVPTFCLDEYVQSLLTDQVSRTTQPDERSYINGSQAQRSIQHLQR